MRALTALLAGVLGLAPVAARAQQVADGGFSATVADPRYAPGEGPRVAVDAGHHNFHTLKGRYAPFAAVLGADGYRVEEIAAELTAESLAGIDILVVANAGTDEASSWALPTPSAFTAAEVLAVAAWVEGGGALFLIADHMPAAGASADLAAAFGLRLTNGYTLQPRPDGLPGDLFSREAGTLRAHAVTDGSRPGERVDEVVTFTGQAFQADAGAGVDTILVFGPEAATLLPVEAGVGFDEKTPRVHSGGWLHAAVLRHGAGRVAVFGEAAMFTAQNAGADARPMGMNHPAARGNQQLLRNTVHWLSGAPD